MATYKVAYLIGSLAKLSINRKLAKAQIAPDRHSSFHGLNR